MKEFLGNYHTVYECKGDLKVPLKIKGSACFSDVFKGLYDKNKTYSIIYKIYIYKRYTLLTDQKNNSCFLNKHELENYINTLKEIVPFKFNIKENERNFIVTIDIRDQPSIVHKYVLNGIRYTYEYPYCMFIIDVYRLRKEKEFLFESIFNIFNLICACSNSCSGIHSVVSGTQIGFLRNRELKAKLKRVRRLNDIISNKTKVSCCLYRKLDNFGMYDIEYWSDDLFKKRKKIYLKAYQNNLKIKE